MALPATHMRFAQDAQAILGVSDVGAYVSGTLYPDSRFVAGIDRERTHPKEWDKDFFLENDFKKGWLVHLVCDQVQGEVNKEWFPEAFVGTRGHGGEAWVKYTALKVIQDLDDVGKFNITALLSGLCAGENPNGEDKQILSQYYNIFTDIYADPSAYTLAKSMEMWRRFGLSEDLIKKGALQVEEYQNNEEVVTKIPHVYEEMLERSAGVLDVMMR